MSKFETGFLEAEDLEVEDLEAEILKQRSWSRDLDAVWEYTEDRSFNAKPNQQYFEILAENRKLRSAYH